MTPEDSTTYQLILNKGRAEGVIAEAQRMILRFGSKRFGPAPASTQTAIFAIADRERLEQMAERVLDASNWDEVLAIP